ncbi:uncharacterized protein [Branchiostoma lanceolatum]|uniref:uncharacterized protein n=1 Tax=Branchiostoma lanceolatum TaxID=7740 RepID=UPI0034563020
MWGKVLLSALLVSVAVSGANAQNNMAPPETSSYTYGYECYCNLDVMFLVDGSSSVGVNGWQDALDYVEEFIKCFNCPRVGFVHCKCEVNTTFPLCYYDNVLDAAGAVEDIAFHHSLTRIGYCIYHAQCTTPWKGAPKIIIVLSDGQIYGKFDGQNTEDVAAYSQNARDAGIEIWAGAAGRPNLINDGGLEEISGSEYRVFNTFDEDPSLLVAVLTIKHCGYCWILVKILPDKQPYPWIGETGGVVGGGRWGFWRRHLEYACDIVMSPNCFNSLIWCQTGLETAIYDVWTNVYEYADKIESRVTERTVIAGKTLEEILAQLETLQEQDALGQIIAEFSRCVQEVISAFRGAMTKLQARLDEYIGSFFLGVFCELVDYWDGIVSYIREYFRKFFLEAFQDFCELLDAVIDKVEKLIESYTWLFSAKVNRFLRYVLNLLKCYLRFKKLVQIFADRVARLLCRFLYWLISRYYLIKPFIYPLPYPYPVPVIEPLPVAPAYP